MTNRTLFLSQVGLAICYDMRFPELSLALAQAGAEILTYPSAFGTVTGPAHWEVRALFRTCGLSFNFILFPQPCQLHFLPLPI